MLLVLLLCLVAGPREAISGKFPRHSEEYEKAFPRPPAPPPDPLPESSAALAALIEGGCGEPRLLAALGEALFREGDRALAYRAFDRAHRMKFDEARMVEWKARCPAVSPKTIEAEEAEARRWVAAFMNFERSRIAEGGDPDDLEEFYELYGRPERSLSAHIRIRRLSFAAGVAGVILGLAFAIASKGVGRRAALAPLLAALALALAPGVLGQTGLFHWGALAAAFGGLAVLVRGRR